MAGEHRLRQGLGGGLRGRERSGGSTPEPCTGSSGPCTQRCPKSPTLGPAVPPGLTWKMARPGLAGGRRGVMARLFSLDSHSWMVTILRAGGGRCRWVRRAFFRWWKSPSVSVYLPGTQG